MAKYCISLGFRPSTMEFSTRHLTLCNHIGLRDCSQFKQVETSQNWFLAHGKWTVSGIAWLDCITSDLDFNKRGCVKQI